MIFPVIQQPRMKGSGKKSGQVPMASSADEFGLGIQVFKIQSSKISNEDNSKPRKAIKNIENPGFVKSSAPVTKKPQVLPSLSTQKKIATTSIKESSKERKSTIQKRKRPYVSSKDVEEKKPLPEKKGPLLGPQKSVQPVEAGAREREVVYRDPRAAFNQLGDFYQRMEEAEGHNLREIRRLRKEKENDEEVLEWRLRCRSERVLLIDSLLNEEKPLFEGEEECFDEFNLTDYVANGQAFRFHDQQPREDPI